MTSAKLEVKVGDVSFSGEGDAAWLDAQFDKLLARIGNGDLTVTSALRNDGNGVGIKTGHQRGDGGLAKFLQSTNVGKNQVKIFLATAAWLMRTGKTRLTTNDVSKALSNANQRKLGNPSDCLSQNIRKGHCEKDPQGFFVTDDGHKSLPG